MLKLNSTYDLEINDKKCKAKLIKIKSYPATGMPHDYMFETLNGEIPIIGDDDTFTLPEFMIRMMSINEVNDINIISNNDFDAKDVLNEMKNFDDINLNYDNFTKLIKKFKKLDYSEEEEQECVEIINKKIDELGQI